MRVLIVEDDPLLGDAVAAGLKQRGFEPDWVQDGREAQIVMRVEPFAAIILDLGLPGLTGLDLAADLRKWIEAVLERASADHAANGAY